MHRGLGTTGALVAGLLVVVAASISCGEPVPTESVGRTISSTVSLGGVSAAAFDSWLPIEVTGEALRTDIVVTLAATVTASTSTRAQAGADKLKFEVLREGGLVVRFAPPDDVGVAGTIIAKVPAAMTLATRVNQGTAIVRNMTAPIEIGALSGALVENCENDIIVGVQSGAAIVDARILGGRSVTIEAARADIELRLPPTVSVDVAAQIAQQGQILIEHPALPAALGPARTNYRATVNGGLSPIRLLTQVGAIVIRAR